MGLYVLQLVALLDVYGYDRMLYLWIEGPHPMIMLELEEDTLELLLEVKRNLRGMGDYDTLDSVIREMCNVYFWRYE